MMNKFILELLDVGCMEEIFALVQWVVELTYHWGGPSWVDQSGLILVASHSEIQYIAGFHRMLFNSWDWSEGISESYKMVKLDYYWVCQIRSLGDTL